MAGKHDVLEQTNIVYELKCLMPHDQMESEIGTIQNTLSED